MDKTAYLNRLLAIYSGTFDIYKPYAVHGKEYPAYGYFFSSVEKYVLAREANLWTSDSYEHVLFLEEEECTIETLQEVQDLWKKYMEPELVCKGKKEPEKNHMYSYLTIAVITDRAPGKEIQKLIKKTGFDKGYRFNIRGFSQGHLVVVSMEDECVYTNQMARNSKNIFKTAFDDVKKGKIGFEELLTKTNKQAFQQTNIVE